MKGIVTALSKSSTHSFSKKNHDSIVLLEGLGVEGDAHCGKKVKHRYDVGKNPEKPNLRQVHLMHTELFDELKEKGFEVSGGELGENITTTGIDLLGLPENTLLHIGKEAKIKVTGLRTPCKLINDLQAGLMNELLDKDEEGNIIRKSGIMSIVIQGGKINVGDEIKIEFPEKPHSKLSPV